MNVGNIVGADGNKVGITVGDRYGEKVVGFDEGYNVGSNEEGSKLGYNVGSTVGENVVRSLKIGITSEYALAKLDILYFIANCFRLYEKLPLVTDVVINRIVSLYKRVIFL